MVADGSGTAYAVRALFSRGRLVAVPRKRERREQLLAYLAETLFARERDYSEHEVNEALLTVHEDFSALRRFLVVGGYLVRPRDGSVYRRGDGPGDRAGAGPAPAAGDHETTAG